MGKKEVVRFACSAIDCGKTLSGPPSLVGKKVRCPHCGKVQRMPEPRIPDKEEARLDALVKMEETARASSGYVLIGYCPECGQRLPVAAKVCTKCGINFRTGESTIVRSKKAPAAIPTQGFFRGMKERLYGTSLEFIVTIIVLGVLALWFFNARPIREKLKLAQELLRRQPGLSGLSLEIPLFPFYMPGKVEVIGSTSREDALSLMRDAESSARTVQLGGTFAGTYSPATRELSVHIETQKLGVSGTGQPVKAKRTVDYVFILP